MADKRLGILVTLKDAASAGFLGLSGKIKLLNKDEQRLALLHY